MMHKENLQSATPGSAGLDCALIETLSGAPGNTLVPTGIAIHLAIRAA
jgi:dUTPase